MIRHYLIICFLLFCSLIGFSQSDDKASKYFPDVFPPTPNSSSLGVFGQVSLNQFTGNQNVIIPLFELKESNIVVPINLSYSSDGVKVDQFESNVGVGWNLNAGGVVTRQIFDVADNYNGRMQKPNLAMNSPEMYAFLNQASVAEFVDTQPDIFTFNIGGRTGKFFLDDSNQVVQIEPSALKISILSTFLESEYEPNSLPELSITDENGIVYYFGGTNAIESTSTRQIMIENPSSHEFSQNYKTAWYLTKIENPLINKSIDFVYESKSVVYFSGHNQNLDYAVHFGLIVSQSLTNMQTRSYCNESLLKEINTDTGKIIFTTSKRFTDADFPFLKIDEINYLTKNNILIKKINFVYDTVIANSFFNSYNQSPEYLKKRLFLKQINESVQGLEPVKHSFEYYYPESLPGRFSFAQDNYGVFNGKNNTSLISDDISVPYSLIQTTFSDQKLANRRPDGNFGYFGMLKKIVYPTKGALIFEYEPHVLGKESLIDNVSKTFFNIDVSTDAETFQKANTANIHSSINQTIFLNGLVKNNCNEENPFPLRAILKIIDLSNNQAISFIDATNPQNLVVIGDSFTIGGNINTKNVNFSLVGNRDYSVQLSLIRPCMFSNVYFNYYEAPVAVNLVDKLIGGFRVSKTIKQFNFEPDEVEKYYYAPKDCLTCQSGSYVSKSPAAYKRYIERVNFCEYPSQREIYAIGSSNLSRIYSNQNAQFAYSFVTKSYGNNFENGGEEFQYDIVQDGLAITSQGLQFDETTPMTNGFGSGNLIKHDIFRKDNNGQFIVLKSKINQYFHDISKDKLVKGYNVFLDNQLFNYSGLTFVCDRIESWSYYSLSEYSLRSQWYYLNKTIEKQYDLNGLNPITTTIDYYFNNPTHLQLTSQIIKDSNEKVLQTNYFYAQDPEMANKPFINELINKNVVGVPFDTQIYKAGVLQSEQLTLYSKDATTNNLLLPKSIYYGQFPNSLPLLLNIGNLEKKVTYDQYDDKGNIQQYTPEGGSPVSIIWGYNKTQPVAKIENVAYSAIPTALISAIENATLSTASEASLLTALTNLRNDQTLVGAMVTTFTYIPLVGVSTITDPKGLKTTYEYDAFNRLKWVKDQDGNVLQRYCYNYQGQQVDCIEKIYSSAVKSGSFTKNNCAVGGVGSPVTYTVAVGAYTSTISQADADTKAQTDVNNNGQTYANTNGICTFSSVAKSGSFTKNNCAAGGVGSPVTYTVAAGAYTSTISQADADNKAQGDVNANGQNYANANGSCMINDNIAPSAPVLTSSSKTSQPSVVLNWTGSTDNVSVTEYQLWRDVNQTGTFSLIATPTTSPYTDVNVVSLQGNSYSYKMRARDAAGNWSAFSNVKIQIVP